MAHHAPPKFYPIVESLDDLQSLTILGYEWIQLRLKLTDRQQLKVNLRAARNLFEQKRQSPKQKLILNDNATLALELKFDGVHLGQTDLDSMHPWLPELQRQHYLIGISTHDLVEVRRALLFNPTYLALGCAFSSSNKPQLAPQGAGRLDQLLLEIRKLTDLPIIAIGGIDRNNYQTLLQSGFDAVSFIKFAQEIIAKQFKPTQLLEI
jgi:thiamine-phosphate diphosphorylase